MSDPVGQLRFDVEVVDSPRVLFRVCRSRSLADWSAAFASSYELGKPPRNVEGRAAVIHMALSMFDTRQAATDLARRFPKIGDHVAELHFEPGRGVCAADTFGPHHWSIWGAQDVLAAMVADVVAVRP